MNTFVRTWTLGLAVTAALGVVGCGGGGGEGGTTSGAPTVAVTGTFTGGTHAKTQWLKELWANFIPPAHALDPNQVAKVIVFYLNNRFVVASVVNGTFSLQVETGAPVGMIFAGTANNYLGYLTLQNGIDTLPLTKLASGVTAINLGTLSSSGLVVEPGNNPLGTELPFSSEEQTALAQMDDFFAAVVKNPDVDGNGAIDILEGRLFRPFVFYYVNGGSFGSNLTPQVISPASLNCSRFAIDIHDTNRPTSVSFTGPPGSGLSNTASDQLITFSNSTIYESPCISDPFVPPAGTYTVLYKTTTLTIQLPDQSGTTSNILLGVPTVTLNPGGTIEKVSWTYRRATGAGTALDPQAVIGDGVFLQIEGNGTPCNPITPLRLYNTNQLSPTTVEHMLTCQNIPFSNVTRMFIPYNDAYGNHVVISWSKP